jgi:hypothetical protein
MRQYCTTASVGTGDHQIFFMHYYGALGATAQPAILTFNCRRNKYSAIKSAHNLPGSLMEIGNGREDNILSLTPLL